MDLPEYLFKNKISITKFAKILGTQRPYVHCWLNGTRIPSKNMLERISGATDGQITRFDQLLDKRQANEEKDNASHLRSGNRKK
jgi:transcriptional regulator with XRE-family HTH domain